MWVIGIAILMSLFIVWIFFRIFWNISKPIFSYLYQSIINRIRSFGITEEAAKAIFSGIIIFLIIILLSLN